LHLRTGKLNKSFPHHKFLFVITQHSLAAAIISHTMPDGTEHFCLLFSFPKWTQLCSAYSNSCSGNHLNMTCPTKSRLRSRFSLSFLQSLSSTLPHQLYTLSIWRICT